MLQAMLCGGAFALTACPYLVEIHADSDPLPDSEGEFLEVLVSQNANPQDTVRIFLDDKMLGETEIAAGTRMVFCHKDSLRILPEHARSCLPLLGALPNTTPLQVILQAGICRDTAWLDRANPGRSWQRDSHSHWVQTQASPGFGLPEIESGIINQYPILLSSSLEESGWQVQFTTDGNARDWQWSIHWISFGGESGTMQQDSANIGDTVKVNQPIGMLPWAHLKLQIFGDDFPLDNVVDTLLYPKMQPPLRITEVAADPEEGWPEWMEVENQSPAAISLGEISPCISMSAIDSSALLFPGMHAILTDSREQLLAAAPGLSQSIILETSAAWSLGNTADTVRLCYGKQQIDSLFWNKEQPLTPQKPSPGWRPPANAKKEKPKLSTRILSYSKPHEDLQILLPEEGAPWKISVWDRFGNPVMQTQLAHAPLYIWKPASHLPLGPYQIHLRPTVGEPLSMGVVLAP